MIKIIEITTHAKQAADDRKFWLSQTPEHRLDAVEKLRLEAGNFLYEYPTRFQRIIRITHWKRGLASKQKVHDESKR